MTRAPSAIKVASGRSVIPSPHAFDTTCFNILNFDDIWTINNYYVAY